MSAFSEYIESIEEKLGSGEATEHTHRSALETLLERIGENIVALNDPKRIECGAPDFRLQREGFTVGHVEAKDIGTSLDDAEDTNQLERYKESLPNLVLTDYLEFRWFVDGEHRMTARWAQYAGGGLRPISGGEKQVKNLLGQVLSHEPEPVEDAEELARRMAKSADMIDSIVVEALREGHASDTLVDLREVTADALIPDMDKPEKLKDFSDMYAQTLAYGLFAARINHDEEGGDFERVGAAREIPKTNPFLRKLFDVITGPDFDDEPYIGFVDDLVQLLNNADIDAVLEDFGAVRQDEDDSEATWQDDPVIHFYETFLSEYDPELRRLRGVYYTPAPVVSYITRSVDHLLKEHFDLDGLADETTFTHQYRNDDGEMVEEEEPRVLVLDPACGTGTFLYHIVDHIRDRFMPDDAGMWSGYVEDHLLPRLFGFERMMAPYAVSHLKLGMQLAAQDLPAEERSAWGYDFESDGGSDDRLSVYLTDTLADPEEEIKQYPGPLRAVSDEAEAAAEVKNALPILAIVGNPPYSNFGQVNNAPWISKNLMEEWKPRGEKKWNPDDFMKFMRWAEWKLDQSGQGVLAFITSRTYLDGITHRTMRQHLRDTFNHIYLLDLHGDILETPPNNISDDPVFDIKRGVAIGLFVKNGDIDKDKETNIKYKDLWGRRHEKYNYLSKHNVRSTDWINLDNVDKETCLGNFYFFAPQGYDFVEEYCSGWSIDDIFETGQNGVKTDRDKLFIDFDEDELKERMRKAYNYENESEEFIKEYRVEDSSSYNLISRLDKTSYEEENVFECSYYPFDERYIYYKKGLTSRPAWGVTKNIIREDNISILAKRQHKKTSFSYIFCTDEIAESSVFESSYANNSVFPLYQYPSDTDRANGGDMFSEAPNGRRPNLSPDFVEDCKSRWGMDFLMDGTGDLETTFGPEDVLHYTYAVLHSPTYRERYGDLLRIDYPRLPLTDDLDLLRLLCEHGKALVDLHLMDWSPNPSEQPSFPEPGSDEVVSRHPRYVAPGDETPDGEDVEEGRVYINEDQYFKGVEPEVWEFHIGGYQVCEKWLKDRKGRTIDSYNEKVHYKNIVATLRQTIHRMEQIDAVIEEHGGWPLADPEDAEVKRTDSNK